VNSQPHDEIQTADPAARRKAVLFVFLVTVVGLGVLALVQTAIGDLRDVPGAQRPEAVARLILLLKLIVGGASVTFVATGLWLWRFAGKVYQAERFPPPGHAVLNDMRVLRGMAAKRRARLGFLLGGLLIVAAVVVFLMAWRLIALLNGA
jgi:hypothetical protein